jgi:hypothetical protein
MSNKKEEALKLHFEVKKGQMGEACRYDVFWS